MKFNNYIDYVNYLKSNNIILFDHDYRISYNNINLYLKKNFNNNELIGGGLNNYNINEITYIINVSLSGNPQYLIYLAKH